MKNRPNFKRWQWWVGIPLLLIVGSPYIIAWIISLPFRIMGYIGDGLEILTDYLNYWLGAKFKPLIVWMTGPRR